MHAKLIFGFIIIGLAGYNVFGQTVSLKGIVTDSVGNPLPGAVVNLKIAGLKDTTDTLGKFTLTNLSTGKFGSSGQTLPLLYSQPLMKSGTLYFSTNQTTKATIEIFTLKGQKVGNSVIQILSQGNFNFPVGNLFPQKTANGFYAIRLTLGNNNFTFKINPMSFTRQSNLANGLSKIKAIVDTLTVHKMGFYVYSLPISNLSGTVPTIVLKSNGIIIPKTTTILDSSMIEKNIVLSSNDSIMTFNMDSLSKWHLDSIDTSKVLVFPPTSLTPYGLLRKVIGLSKTGKTLTLYTRQASLAEAITTGHFDTTVALVFPDSFSLKKKSSININTKTQELQQSFHVVLDDQIDDNIDEQITADGYIKTIGAIHLTGNISMHGIDNIIFNVSLTDTASLTINSTLKDSIQVKNKFLTVTLQTVVIDIGIPVCITPVIEFYVGMNGKITSSVTAGLQYINIFSAGVTYQNSTWTVQNSTVQQFTVTPFLPATTASFQGFIEGDVICKFYDLVGPKLIATGDVQLDATLNGNPQWTCGAALTIGTGVQISVYITPTISLKLVDTSFNVFNQYWRLAQSAPLGFIGSIGDSKVNLSWNDYVGADSFNVYMSTSNSLNKDNYKTLSGVQKISTSSTSLEIDNLADGQTYYFILTAHDQASKIESFATSPISITPVSGVVAPQTPTPTSPADGTIGLSLASVLTWSTVTDAAMYHVQISTVNTFATIEVEDSTLTSATKALNGLTNSTQYYWRVRAKNAGGVSAWTSPWSFTTIIPVNYPGMVLIPGGMFTMGNDSIASPSHQVTLSSFYMDSTDVTQADYLALMGVNPAYFNSDTKRPVETVSWFDAALYCNKRSKRDGFDTVYTYLSAIFKNNPATACSLLINIVIDYSKKGYRLPTEAEWEYACRGGTTTKYWWGSDTNGMGIRTWSPSNSNGTTHPVATLLANTYGLYDITGNVFQWCNDWMGAYTADAEINPTGPATGSGRILRGGAWCFVAYSSATRALVSGPSGRINYIGFRVVVLPQ